MKQAKLHGFFLLLILATRLGAQEYNSVPLNHPAYNIIEMGIIQGIILPPHGVKPWSAHTVKQKLREMADDSTQAMSALEEEAVLRALDSLERTTGFNLRDGRYRAEGSSFAFEAGLGLENNFQVETPDTSFSSAHVVKAYLGGDMARFASWNIAASGKFLTSDEFTFSPGIEAELNGAFFNQRLQLRMGRIRHDWGSNGASLFLNAHAPPLAAFEGTYAPLSWLNVSFLCGAAERFGEGGWQPDEGLFSNMLSAAQIEFTPLQYLRFHVGGAAVLPEPDMAFFTGIGLLMPGLFSLWGNLFVDRLHSSSKDFFAKNSNSYAGQAGLKANIHWLPFAAFIIRYTKIEPYCYKAFVNGGESLGYYLPPNSDELLLRLESVLFPDANVHVQFQMIRHGADYGYGAVGGSSLYDTLELENSIKYFLMDGVYQWDNIIKLGGSYNLKAAGIPLSLYAETGFVLTNFTINGSVGVGNEADYEPLDNEVYRARNGFVFSIGFRLFP